MTDASRERLFGFDDAFAHPITRGVVIVVVLALLVGGVTIALLGRRGNLSDSSRSELRKRFLSWLVLVPLMVGPVLLGAFWSIAAVCVLSLLAFSEFARATGIFREKLLSLAVVVGIVFAYFAVLDNWYEFFVAVTPLNLCVIASITLYQDRPKGYIQRVATAGFGFLFFGTCLGHLACMMNLVEFRPFVLWLLLCVEMSDVFGFVVGKTIGNRKLLANTSPGKTLEGCIGSIVLTATLASSMGYFLFADGPLRNPVLLIALGLLVPIAAQLGDLMLSAVKRDLGVKDLGAALPGHGGVLDRFDSLLLVAPVVFQFCSALGAWEFDRAARIFTGG